MFERAYYRAQFPREGLFLFYFYFYFYLFIFFFGGGGAGMGEGAGRSLLLEFYGMLFSMRSHSGF